MLVDGRPVGGFEDLVELVHRGALDDRGPTAQSSEDGPTAESAGGGTS